MCFCKSNVLMGISPKFALALADLGSSEGNGASRGLQDKSLLGHGSSEVPCASSIDLGMSSKKVVFSLLW